MMKNSAAAFALPLLLLIGCSTGAKPEANPTPDTATEEVVDAPRVGDLLDPSTLNATAPDSYKVKFVTTKGDVIITVHRDWAPLGADRFYNLVNAGFFDDVAFFRAIEGFMVQFGVNGDPKVNTVWQPASIKDDPFKKSNTRGRLTFAMGGPNTRTTQMFISYGDNSRLDHMNFPSLGEVTSGMEVIDSLYTGYGEGAPNGRGPAQHLVQARGNEYLRSDFPELDYIEKAVLVP
jgi:cyclophilin family peptidyl-prolyl cis-trans isomerase